MLETSASISRQYIDAVSVFEALEEAQTEAAHVRGGMYWHAGTASAPDTKYLVRTTPAGAETSLGPRTPENESIYERFTQRKRESAERVTGLKAALEQHQRLNRALRVGRVDPLVVALLNRLASNGTMARMNTIHPATFVAFKRWMAAQPDREALKRRRDVLQADTVQTLMDKYLP